MILVYEYSKYSYCFCSPVKEIICMILISRKNIIWASLCKEGCLSHRQTANAHILVAEWPKQQNDLCAQWRIRSAWASAQTDQSLHSPHEETMDPCLPIEHTAKTLIRLGGLPGWSESSVGAQVILLVLSCSGSYGTNENFRQRAKSKALYGYPHSTKVSFSHNIP